MIYLHSLISHGYAADILLSMPYPLHTSHVSSMAAIVTALAANGHNVTLLTGSNRGGTGFKNDTYKQAILYELDEESLETVRRTPKDFLSLLFNENPTMLIDDFKMIQHLLDVFHLGSVGCRALFRDEIALAKLRSSHFDLMIADSFDGGDALVYGYLKDVPLVVVTTSMRYPVFHELMFGMPAPSSYISLDFFSFSDRMSFFERILSFFEHHIIFPLVGTMITRPLEQLKSELGIRPDKSVQSLLAEAQLWLSATDFSLDFPRPSIPNWIPIGGLLNKPSKPLTQEYEDFVNGAGEHGFIIFSLGSMIPRIPIESMVETFARVFSELPQRVIWRCSGPKPRFLGNNTKLVDWLPQNDLLGHPKARLMVYHGGANGVFEAIYHGVPMVIIPLFAEQKSIGVKVKAKGMGEVVNKEDVSYETVGRAIRRVLDDQSYTYQARLYSGIHRDRMFQPTETAVFWIEHVIKYGGAHLKTRATELGFIQLHNIDVIVFCMVITLVTFYLLVRCCARVCCCACRGARFKTKRD
ncbi:UDP-glucuronosyltransferase 1-2-like [Diadema antillarum]|uniref:UDP-glucuronosyltransferase 1-2-like n=1 Tax=Diadema antillarum TaxID=105358 RepID=UPI003A8C5148